MNEIFYKEVDVLGMKCENVILCTESAYYIESGKGFKDRIVKILNTIKAFFAKLKAKVDEKIRSVKIKKDVKRLNAIIESKKSDGIMIDIDTTKNLVEVRLAAFLRDADKVTKLKDPKKVQTAFNKIYDAACKDIDLYISASKGGKLHKKFIKRVKLREAAKMALSELKNVNSDLDKVYRELSATVKKSTSIRSMFKESTDNEDESYLEAGETNSENNSVDVAIASKVHGIGIKVGTFVAKHPFIITTAVFAAGAVVYKKGYESGHSSGKEVGWRKGMKAGEQKGLELGRKEGRLSGFIKGKDVGMTIGNENGRKLGRREGELIGRQKGFNDGRELGRKEGLLVGQKKNEKAYREGHKNGENAGIIKTIGSVMNSIERNKRQSSSSVKQIGTSNRRTK